MSSSKAWAAAAALAWLAAGGVAQAAQNGFECPAQISIDGVELSLANLNVFDGPIENRVALVPETVQDDPDTLRWELDANMAATMKCRYRDSRHYVVLVAEGATQCTVHAPKGQVAQASCKAP
ncbi:STY0301 family protein [Achromobacter seleniivolatilans]|uniref:STY0301 family protein n=1 Tax=Achromobacter seleniivolatilans TaxID=3047478 RepID=A0ABY9M269_9BURK|nr:STY0301 family protein [Achromobacter sp. R39]WMD19952.1 STY0301 family protein [Achromobacter sp. R39]